ncbi:uncharacterized protein LTR77_008232 [Saxophila tyrrhenica]|uniref:BTB domain-containing protein n=1 Tax=Saxophila tyrrhenica TaxID=1690608 RepID=A0AAV9P573_9PEZI|nr:hypothetical protein LTR77_008232 [Saxophila tyrrhenica]
MAISVHMEGSTASPWDGEPELKPELSPTYIKLIVGPQRQVFEFQEDLICNKCPFFYNAFCGNFLEAKTKQLELPDDDPERFQELDSWLQQDVIDDTQSWLALSRTWLFADKYHIDELQNAIVDALYRKYTAHNTGINIAFETLDYIAEHTYKRSPLRLLFADMLVNGTSLQQIPDRADNIPHEFMQEMWLSLKSYIARNGPANTSLLTNPIHSYYVSSAAAKATAMPKPVDPADAPTDIFCQSWRCEDSLPIRDTLYMCTNHNVTLCRRCRDSHRGHRKKMMTLTTAPYRDAATGEMTIIDAQINDSGFYCDGPKCDTREFELGLPDYALMSGDRSSFARKTWKTECVSIPEKQRRLAAKLCLRCAGDDHLTDACEAKEAVLDAEVEVEE